jgi:hypothetical protein
LSYILEALRRAERERGPAQPLAEQPATTTVNVALRMSAGPWLLLGFLLAFVAGGWLIFLVLKPASPPIVVSAAAPSNTPVQAAPTAAPPAETTVIPPDAAQTINSFDDLMQAPATLPATAAAPAAQEQSAADETAAAATEDPATASEVKHIQLAPAPPHEVSLLSDMPSDYRADFPRLSLDAHVYDDDPSHRFVMLSGHRYHEGDVVKEGPRVVEITAEGVVLGFRGQQVLFPLDH